VDLLAVDPGLRGCGVALFNDGQLQHAEYVIGSAAGVRAGAWQPMAEAVRLWATYRTLEDTTLVVELPQVYVRARSKGDPNDLIDLAAVVGALVAYFPVGATVYLPAEWKGQVPKEIIHARAASALSAWETRQITYPKRKGLAHNVLDAVALGLCHLGRTPGMRAGYTAARAA
jgi:hypothetical protein